MKEIVAQRVFNPLYIYLDICFLVFLCAMLVVKKKYLTLLFGLAGGVLYMIVDYGIFHLWTHSRTIEGGDMFWVLLWMSMSYGITNFVWIWLWFSKDKHLLEWSLLIVVWWIAAPMLASTFGKDLPPIKIQRTTGSYHGYMALILFAGYAAAIVFNLLQKDKKKRFPLAWMLAIGILVQFAWEFSLLAGGIRSAEFADFGEKIKTLVINSLLETNLGAVPIFCIYLLVTARINEDLTKREKTTFLGRMAEINATSVRFGPPQAQPTELKTLNTVAMSSTQNVEAVAATVAENSTNDEFCSGEKLS